MSELPAIIVAASGTLGSLGVAGRFIYNKVESRFNHMEAQLQECAKRDRAGLEYRILSSTLIDVLYGELKRGRPNSAALKTARPLMVQLKVGTALDLVKEGESDGRI
jgi:hypothetical protein